MKYVVKFQHDVETEVEAASITEARAMADIVRKQFPLGTCKLMSIIVEGYVDKPEPLKPTPPRGVPPSGTPGAGTPKVPVLVDQIASAA